MLGMEPAIFARANAGAEIGRLVFTGVPEGAEPITVRGRLSPTGRAVGPHRSPFPIGTPRVRRMS